MSSVVTLDDLRTDIALRNGTVHPVSGVSLTVSKGESLGIVGESGCGKTMTALSIIRLLPPGGRVTSGSITLGDTDLATLDEAGMRKIRGNRIGMIFQDPMTSLNPCMTIGDQVSETVLLHRDVTRAQARERAAEVLDLVGLPRAKERLDSYPHLLSGGMRQRVVIAMALACEPELLIADEPTTALDATIQKQILELIDRSACAPRYGGDPGDPRPRRHRRIHRPGGGDVRRKDRGDQLDAGAVRQPTAPLH